LHPDGQGTDGCGASLFGFQDLSFQLDDFGADAVEFKGACHPVFLALDGLLEYELKPLQALPEDIRFGFEEQRGKDELIDAGFELIQFKLDSLPFLLEACFCQGFFSLGHATIQEEVVGFQGSLDIV